MTCSMPQGCWPCDPQTRAYWTLVDQCITCALLACILVRIVGWIICNLQSKMSMPLEQLRLSFPRRLFQSTISAAHRLPRPTISERNCQGKAVSMNVRTLYTSTNQFFSRASSSPMPPTGTGQVGPSGRVAVPGTRLLLWKTGSCIGRAHPTGYPRVACAQDDYIRLHASLRGMRHNSEPILGPPSNPTLFLLPE